MGDKSKHHFRIWPAACLVSIIAILAGYLLLVLSNAVYLGVSDSLYFFRHPRLWNRLFLTAWTATAATACSLCIGIPAGYALSRFRLPCSAWMATLMDLPVLVPPAAVGAFLFGFTHTFPVRDILDLFGISISRTATGVVFAQFVVTVAFCARLMKTAFDRINPRFEFVSRSLGASRQRTFFHVTLPLARRGIIASLIVVWARAAAEWEALMLFVGGTEGKTDTLAFAVYLDWNGGMMGWVVSLSLLCIFMAIGTMGAVRIIGRKSYVW
ncbi:MAG: ABC transporter permease subunit [Acidobacteriota bacterium]|jgi:molybdate transport system permease protein|nr:ABC transporter permease subunit [Acidobacteriota bacterium]